MSVVQPPPPKRKSTPKPRVSKRKAAILAKLDTIHDNKIPHVSDIPLERHTAPNNAFATPSSYEQPSYDQDSSYDAPGAKATNRYRRHTEHYEPEVEENSVAFRSQFSKDSEALGKRIAFEEVNTPAKPYDQRVFRYICSQLSLGRALKSVIMCDRDIIPELPNFNSFWFWLQTVQEAQFLYARAKDEAAEHLAEEIITIADDESLDPQSRRVRVDSRKWVAAKLKPRKYGDFQQVEHKFDWDGDPRKLSSEQLAKLTSVLEQIAFGGDGRAKEQAYLEAGVIDIEPINTGESEDTHEQGSDEHVKPAGAEESGAGGGKNKPTIADSTGEDGGSARGATPAWQPVGDSSGGDGDHSRGDAREGGIGRERPGDQPRGVGEPGDRARTERPAGGFAAALARRQNLE